MRFIFPFDEISFDEFSDVCIHRVAFGSCLKGEDSPDLGGWDFLVLPHHLKDPLEASPSLNHEEVLSTAHALTSSGKLLKDVGWLPVSMVEGFRRFLSAWEGIFMGSLNLFHQSFQIGVLSISKPLSQSQIEDNINIGMTICFEHLNIVSTAFPR